MKSNRDEIVHIRPKISETDKEKTIRSSWGEVMDPVAPVIDRKDVDDFNEVFCLYNVFTEDECAKLVHASESTGYGKTSYPPQYRGNLRLMSFDDSLANVIFERIKDHLPETLTHCGAGTWRIHSMNTKFRLAKYYPGNKFDTHCDAAFGPREDFRSFYTVNIYMNDDFTGGCTRFYQDDLDKHCEAIQPIPGMALIFRQPPGESHYHDGEIVKSGIKYLLRTDVMYARVAEKTP